MLDAYVAREDPSYACEVRREGEIDETRYVELVLTSQTWREVAWRHQLYVLWPTTMEENARHALLFLHGGSWRPALEDPELAPPLPREAAFLAPVAEALGTPLVYTGDGEQTLFLLTGVRIASRSPPTNLSRLGEPATPGPAHPR